MQPKMLLYGNLGGIEFSYDQWQKLCDQKEFILNFMARKVQKLRIDLSTPENSLIISGRIAKSPLLYMYQTDLVLKETSYICIADPTVAHLFEMSDLFEYYFCTLERSTQTISNFCKGVKDELIKIVDSPTFIDGIDYNLLHLELKHFPHGCIVREKKRKIECVDVN